jgi:hypothetical protein
MAVIYTPSGQNPVTIGGTAFTGPFPSYNIKRSVTPSQDGTVINNKYTISVRGSVIIPSSVDITESGARQSAVHAEIIKKLQIGIQNNHNYGRLEIVPYGGQPNALDFIDARLIDIDIPEPSDENAFNTLMEYSFTFEASIDASNRDADILFLVDSIEESWSINLGQGVTTNPDNVSGTEFNKTYSITHTISATGRRRLDNSGNFDKSSWYEAKKWVTSRLVDSPASSIIEDFFGGDEFTTFLPTSFSDISETTLINLNEYQFYNHLRIPQTGLTNGTYSVTETWDASPYPAVLTMEVGMEEDSNGIVTVNVNGSIDGYNVNGPQDRTIDKYDSAREYFAAIEPNIYNIANHYFSQDYQTPLRQYPKTKTIGRNVTSGIITFNYSFDDTAELIQHTISASVNISDDNELKNTQVVAIIPVIARRLGPIIQNMATTKESRRSVNFSCVMQRGFRDQKPEEARGFVLNFAPDNSFLEEFNDEFDPISGAYQLTASWVY